MGAKQFGARVARLEDPALLRGRGRFVDDIKPAGTLHACFVRSPHAHARIRAIDTTRAQLPLARTEVCYVGQTIAVVVAESRYLAEDAAAAVAIEFEPLPAV